MTAIHGSAREIFALLTILENNCTSPPDMDKTCPAHSMLIMPQKQMDALVFNRRYWEKRGAIER